MQPSPFIRANSLREKGGPNKRPLGTALRATFYATPEPAAECRLFDMTMGRFGSNAVLQAVTLGAHEIRRNQRVRSRIVNDGGHRRACSSICLRSLDRNEPNGTLSRCAVGAQGPEQLGPLAKLPRWILHEESGGRESRAVLQDASARSAFA